jgi:hypothetical protein
MNRENADREDAYRETMMRYELFIAEMRAQADEFWKPRTASKIPCLMVKGMVSGAGAAGALS